MCHAPYIFWDWNDFAVSAIIVSLAGGIVAGLVANCLFTKHIKQRAIKYYSQFAGYYVEYKIVTGKEHLRIWDSVHIIFNENDLTFTVNLSGRVKGPINYIEEGDAPATMELTADINRRTLLEGMYLQFVDAAEYWGYYRINFGIHPKTRELFVAGHREHTEIKSDKDGKKSDKDGDIVYKTTRVKWDGPYPKPSGAVPETNGGNQGNNAE